MDITLNSATDLTTLIEPKKDGARLSMYIPVHPQTRSETINEDTIRFGNVLAAAKEKLSKDSRPNAKAVLKQAAKVEDIFSNKSFWENQLRGLAVFVDDAEHHIVRLPYEVSEQALIEDHFIISPLVAMKQLISQLYILDVNTKSPALFEYKEGSVSEVNDAHLPPAMSEALQLDELNKAQQFHTGEGSRRAVYHGHGGDAAKDNEVESYLRLLADKVDLYLKKLAVTQNDGNTPLVLMGSKDRVALLKEALEHDDVIEHASSASADSPRHHEQLQKTSEAIIDELMDSDQKQIVNELEEKHANELTVVGAQAIEKACAMNNVEKLLIPILKKTNDSVRNGIERQYKFVLPDSIADWDQTARKSIDCGALVRAIDSDNHSLPDEIIGICRFKLDLK